MANGYKTGGRRKGATNQVTREFKETVLALLRENSENVSVWLETVATGSTEDGLKPDPGRALDLLSRLAEYATPKLGRTEVVGDPEKPLQHTVKVEIDFDSVKNKLG